jgi:phage-related protein (TIGR01555 family)
MARLLQERLDAVLQNSSYVSGGGFVNTITGFGTSRDKTEYGTFGPKAALDTETLSALYHGSDLSARVVEARAEEEFRPCFEPTAKGLSEDVLEVCKDDLTELGAKDVCLEGRIWGLLYGGAATIIGAEDGGSAGEPLDLGRIRSVDWLTTIDRRYLCPNKLYERGPRAGQPETYWLTTSANNGGRLFEQTPNPASCEVHESRMLLWPGVRTARRERDANGGWDHSVLDKTWTAVRTFETLWKAVEILMTDGPTGVYKITGLLEAISQKGEQAIAERLALVDMLSSVLRAKVVDSTESFERSAMTFTGIPEILRELKFRLSAAVQLPQLILFGEQVGGLGDSGNSSLTWFFNRVEQDQSSKVAPRLRRLCEVLLAWRGVDAKGKGLDIKFGPLWTPTATEAATIAQAEATTDVTLVNAGIITAEEVGISRYASKAWAEKYTAFDSASREKALKDVMKGLVEGAKPGSPDELGEGDDSDVVDLEDADQVPGGANDPEGTDNPEDPEDDPPPEPKPRKDYSEDQPREEDGKFGEGGGGSGKSSDSGGGKQAAHKFEPKKALAGLGGKKGTSIKTTTKGTQLGGKPAKAFDPEKPEAVKVAWANGSEDRLSDKEGEADTYLFSDTPDDDQAMVGDRVYEMAREVATAYDREHGLDYKGGRDEVARETEVLVKEGKDRGTIYFVRPPDKEEGRPKRYKVATYSYE